MSKLYTEANFKVFTTRYYDLFKTLKGNRIINWCHVKQIAVCMNAIGALRIPILVNEKFEVIDGQHRLEACKTIGTPIYFIIQSGLDNTHCSFINSCSKNWTTIEYIQNAAIRGNQNYQMLLSLIEEYVFIPNSTIINICCDRDTFNGPTNDYIRSGAFKLGKEKLRKVTDVLDYIATFEPTIASCKGRKEYLCNVLAFIYQNIDYDKTRLEKVLRKQNEDGKCFNIESITGAIKDIETIYNKSLKKEQMIPFSFEYERLKK